MRYILSAALFLTAALPAFAQSTLTAAEFEAYATGKTLTYSVGGQVFGTEQYLPGRKVRWAFTGDECTNGSWYEEAGQICFVYDHDGTPQCWTFTQSDTGLKAKFAGDGPANELSEVAQTDKPLPCQGPDVGA